jgi:hypothetical protein
MGGKTGGATEPPDDNEEMPCIMRRRGLDSASAKASSQLTYTYLYPKMYKM